MGRSLTGPGNIARSGDSMLGAFNEAKGNDIASTSVVNLVIATGNLIDITGGNTILSMVLASGAERVLRFTGSLRLTNSGVLVCPGGADIITLPGDFATVRGYPGGVVRIVVYTRATGYVQRIGDQLLGNLTLTPGTNTVAPLKYQAGVLMGITVPHAHEWSGNNLFLTQASGVRKQVMYTDDNASLLTGITSLQVTNALGYTPFNAGTTPSTISPAGGLIEVGRYLDFHSENSNNDFDARIECQPTAGSSGTSHINFSVGNILVNTYPVWTTFNLTNLSQLVNGPSYASTNSPTLQTPTFVNPTVTGQLTIPNGDITTPGIRFANSTNTGLWSPNPGYIYTMISGVTAMSISSLGVKMAAGVNTAYGNNGGQILLEGDSGGIAGDLVIGQNGSYVRFTESGGSQRGAYLSVANCDPNGATRILTEKDVDTYSLSTTGYTKFPNGLIIQWGKRANVGVGSGYVAFPMTFPTVCVNVQASYDRSTLAGSYGSLDSVTTSGVQIWTDNCNTFWMAIGY